MDTGDEGVNANKRDCTSPWTPFRPGGEEKWGSRRGCGFVLKSGGILEGMYPPSYERNRGGKDFTQ